MKLIVAADKNWGIGKDGKLLASIPEDMRFFKETTIGHVVVMGRKTLESFPGGRPLRERVNIVLTRDPQYVRDGVTVVHSVSELEEELAKYPSGEVFVIGGDSIYRQLLQACDTAYVTRIDQSFEADAWFPDLDRLPEWKKTVSGEEQLSQGRKQGENHGREPLRYRFDTYVRR